MTGPGCEAVVTGAGGTRILFHGCRRVDQEAGTSGARALCRQAMQSAGLDRETLKAELLTIVDELAHNIIRYGRQGFICITVYVEPAAGAGSEGDGSDGSKGAPEGLVFRVVAEDRGGGIKDLAKALEPGYSSGGGLGRGLNLLQALADDVRISSLLDGGTRVEVWRAVT